MGGGHSDCTWRMWRVCMEGYRMVVRYMDCAHGVLLVVQWHTEGAQRDFILLLGAHR